MKLRSVWRWVGVLVGGLALLLVLSGGMFGWALHASLAQVEGRRTLPGLKDGLGRGIAGLSGGSFSGRVGMR